MKNKPLTTHVTPHEGGLWIPFEEYNGYSVHSIKFADGSVWDTRNGWREVQPNLADELERIAEMMQPVSPTRKLMDLAAFTLRMQDRRIKELEGYGPRTSSAALEPGA